jgi:hypothetical protein
VTHFEYPPSDPNPFQHTTYDHTTGYFAADGQYCMPLGSQHQQNLVSDHAGYLRCDDSFDHYETVTQHPILPIPPSSGSSELGNALVEISPPEPQPMSRASIALPSLPLPSQPAPKHDPSEGAVGHPVKTEYGTTASGQPFSSMAPLGSPSLTSDHAPYIKEEVQDHFLSMPRSSTPHHGHSSLRHRQHTQESFRLVQDPAAYPGFASSAKVRSYLMIAYTYSSIYRGTRRHRPSLFLYITRILLAVVSRHLSRRRSRLPIRERLHQ